jgi:hypothetical protein
MGIAALLNDDASIAVQDEIVVRNWKPIGWNAWSRSKITSKSSASESRRYSAASLALLFFLGLPSAFFNTGAKNFPV